MGGGTGEVVTIATGMAKEGSASSGAAEGEFINAKTSVWWDIENCPVPRGCEPHDIAKNISTSLANMGYKGVISSISAYGDTSKITSNVQNALHSTGVTLNHVPAGVKDASDKKIMVDMLLWAIDNPRPANYLLISSDRDFSYALHQLRRRRYNILLSHAPHVSQALVAAAKCVWLWTSLLSGEAPLNNGNQSVAGSHSNGEASRAAISERKQHTDSSRNTQSVMNTQGARLDKQPKGRQTHKAVNNGNPPSPGMPGSNRDTYNKLSNSKHPQPSQTSTFSTASSMPFIVQPVRTHMPAPDMPSELVNAQSKLNAESVDVRGEPHTFFGGVDHYPNVMVNPREGNGPISNQMRPQLLRPSDIRPPPSFNPPNLHERDTTRHEPSFSGNSSFLQPLQYNGSQFTSPVKRVPNINRSNIPHRPHGNNHHDPSYHNNQEQMPNPVSYPSSSAVNMHLPKVSSSFPYAPEFRPSSTQTAHAPGVDVWKMPGTDQPNDDALFHIGKILLALHILRTDKMAPTVENIADCIHYGEEIKLPDFNVSLGLDYGIRYSMIEKQTLGASLQYYIRKNDKLWACVNVMDSSKHPKAVWDAIQTYLASPSGRSAILDTKCRYQAATILKKNCFPDRVMGDVIQILNSLINNKKWLVPHPAGWQPLAVKLPFPSES